VSIRVDLPAPEGPISAYMWQCGDGSSVVMAAVWWQQCGGSSVVAVRWQCGWQCVASVMAARGAQQAARMQCWRGTRGVRGKRKRCLAQRAVTSRRRRVRPLHVLLYAHMRSPCSGNCHACEVVTDTHAGAAPI
jgi:hypothetical protein